MRKSLRRTLAPLNQAFAKLTKSVTRSAAAPLAAATTNFRERVITLYEDPKSRALGLRMIFDQVYNQIWTAVDLNTSMRDVYGYLYDIFRADDGSFFAVLVKDGHLFRGNVTLTDSAAILDAPEKFIEIVTDFMPAAAPATRTIIREVEGGRYRWLSISSVAALNRVGEIDSTKLYDSMIANAERTGNYPYRTFYHEGPAFRTGQCDFMARDGLVLITSGLYDDTDFARQEVKARLANPEFWGESIQFQPTADPELLIVRAGDGLELKIPVYVEGAILEISNLPEAEAASWGTQSTEPQEVLRNMDKNSRQYKALVKLYGGDTAAVDTFLASQVEETNRAASGQINRADTNDPASTSLAASAAPAASAPATPPPAAADATTTATQSAAPAATIPAAPAAPATEPAAPVNEGAPPELEVDDELVDEIASRVIASTEFSQMSQDLAAISQNMQALSTQISAANQRSAERFDAIESDLNQVADVINQDLQEAAHDAPGTRARLLVTYRPRMGNGAPPARARLGAVPQQEDVVPLSDIADATLAMLPQRGN